LYAIITGVSGATGETGYAGIRGVKGAPGVDRTGFFEINFSINVRDSQTEAYTVLS